MDFFLHILPSRLLSCGLVRFSYRIPCYYLVLLILNPLPLPFLFLFFPFSSFFLLFFIFFSPFLSRVYWKQPLYFHQVELKFANTPSDTICEKILGLLLFLFFGRYLTYIRWQYNEIVTRAISLAESFDCIEVKLSSPNA